MSGAHIAHNLISTENNEVVIASFTRNFENTSDVWPMVYTVCGSYLNSKLCNTSIKIISTMDGTLHNNARWNYLKPNLIPKAK